MYNGIGLETARGSGTNGYVQRNLSFIRRHKDNVDYKSEEELRKLDSQLNRGPSREILDHERKRKVELKCMEMQELMEEQGYNEEEISRKVSVYRQMLMENLETTSGGSVGVSTVERDDTGRPIAKETHQIAEASQARNDQLRAAFGLSEFYKDGTSLDPQRKAKEQAAEALAAVQKKYAMVDVEPSSSSSSPSPSPERKKKHKEKKKSDKSGGGHDKAQKKRTKRGSDEGPSAESRKRKKAKSANHQKDREHQQTELLASADAEKIRRRNAASSESVEDSGLVQHGRRGSPPSPKHGQRQKSRIESAERLRHERTKMAAAAERRRRSESESRSADDGGTRRHTQPSGDTSTGTRHRRQSPGSPGPRHKRKSARSQSPPAVESKRRRDSTGSRSASAERRARPAVDRHGKKSDARPSKASPSRPRKSHKRHDRDDLDDID